MIYDISYPLHPSIQVYNDKAAKRPTFQTVADHVTGSVHETDITINLHTGTHVDYPLHMIANGDTSDTEDLSLLIGSAKVLDCTNVGDVITKDHLVSMAIEEDDFLLFKTKNSFSEHFLFDFTYLSADGAEYLRQKNIRGVGTDGLGIERAQAEHPTHKTLLSNGIVILEGLRLKDVEAGLYHMICLPLNIVGVEASLARVILTDD